MHWQLSFLKTTSHMYHWNINLYSLGHIWKGSIRTWKIRKKYHHVEYLSRLKQLDLLPLEYKFRLTDLMLFHDIVYNISTINLPGYIVQADNNDIAANNSRLRQYINPPLYHASHVLKFDLEAKRAS